MKFTAPTILHTEPKLEEFKEKYSTGLAFIAYRCYLRVYQRTRLSEAQNHRCCWCGTRMNNVLNDPAAETIDHVIPRSNGGIDHPDNYVISCYKCNSTRGSLPAEIFAKYIANPHLYDIGYMKRTNSDHNEKKQELRNQLFEKGIKYSKKAKVGRLSRKLRHHEIASVIDSDRGNIYEPGSKEYKKYEQIKKFEEAKRKML